ncbi:10500_t:CDS:2 [Funneliformis caledonium]|uniref:10500_t:CDS:1 n=1 Tax=Funneliformis caledonium TaxID=1117310 RepID=A0A9N9D2B1_9GLOM|nr:10500_t:CDS:2 [Funneliformis caledonium]
MSSSKRPMPTQAFVSTNTSSLNPTIKEQQYVHDVYEKIAQHFSSTRYKPWPVVEEFLKEMEIGSIGVDIGCGNGKYLGVNRNVYIIGADRSSSLIEISASRGFETLICDALNLPYRDECFSINSLKKNDSKDFVISIAVIHHFTTLERRIAATKELFRIVKPGSKILIYVWAMEQIESRRKFDENYQDVFVPWVIPADKNEKEEEIVYDRIIGM